MTSTSTLKDAALRFADVVDTSLQMVGHLRGHVETLASDAQRDAAAVAKESRTIADAASHKILLAKRGIRASPKALRITASLLTIIARYRLEEGRQKSHSQGREERTEALHQSCAELVRKLCEEQRGATLKLGQFLSMRPDLLPAAYIRELANLRDNVPPLPFEAIAGDLEAELGRPLEECFAEITEEAAQAASLAQVHRARGAAGEMYALKIQLPEAREEAMADIAILQALAATLPAEGLPFDVGTTLEEIANSVREELDYEAEASHLRNIGAALAEMPGILIPKAFPDLSSSRVLTMEWLDGVPLDRALAAAGHERKRSILTRLVRCFAAQIFEHGYFHADPHAGNVLIREDETNPEGFTLILLDFGCAANLGDVVRDAYVQLLFSLFANRRDQVIASLETLGFEQAGGNSEGLAQIAETMLAPLQREGALAEWARDPKAGAKALMEMSRSVPGLKTPRHFILLGRVLATLGGILIEHADADVSLPGIIASELARVQSSARR